ncbi:hypothetical protein MN116_000500 [Schistosoma mekongi]|uniref:Uncharacterized protein n=1 Tax=Schistosoma mekongi TaxID=38744 RepID=A0AAE2D5K2_SCHME|nr:hypothetical protein MN116_000500 [Schistosoma mekongi]
MTFMCKFKKKLYYSLHICVIHIISGLRCLFCEAVNKSITEEKPNDNLIMWISMGLGLSVAVLVITVFCLTVVVCNLRSIKDDENPATFKDPIVSGNNSLPGDRVLATSAQRYHFSHQKQQMLAEYKFSVVSARDNSPTKVLYSNFKPAEKLEIENPCFTGPENISDNISEATKE